MGRSEKINKFRTFCVFNGNRISSGSVKSYVKIFSASVWLTFYCMHAVGSASLNGLAPITELGKTCFYIAFYSDRATTTVKEAYNENYARKVVIRVEQKKVFSRRFKNLWTDLIVVNNPEDILDNQIQNILDFSSLLKVNLFAGDILEVSYLPYDRVDLVLNGTELGSIQDYQFFNIFLSVLFGEVPLSSNTKYALISGGPDKVQKNHLLAFNALIPSQDRINHIASLYSEDFNADVEAGKSKQKIGVKIEKTPDIKVFNQQKTIKNHQSKPAKVNKKKRINSNESIGSLARYKPDSSKSSDRDFLGDADTMDDETYFEWRRQYLGGLYDWLEQKTRHPLIISKRPEKNSVKAVITLDHFGNITKTAVTRVKGGVIKPELKIKTESMIKKIKAFPVPKKSSVGSTFTFKVFFSLHWRYAR